MAGHSWLDSRLNCLAVPRHSSGVKRGEQGGQAQVDVTIVAAYLGHPVTMTMTSNPVRDLPRFEATISDSVNERVWRKDSGGAGAPR